jgi:nucleoside-triphosphatase THEP1
MDFLKKFIARKVRTECSRTSYRIVPLTNSNKYLHKDTSETEVNINKSVLNGSERLLKKTLRLHAHHVTKHNTPMHNILSTVSQFSISQKALATIPEDGTVMPKHVGATMHY